MQWNPFLCIDLYILWFKFIKMNALSWFSLGAIPQENLRESEEHIRELELKIEEKDRELHAVNSEAVWFYFYSLCSLNSEKLEVFLLRFTWFLPIICSGLGKRGFSQGAKWEVSQLQVHGDPLDINMKYQPYN